MQAHEFDYQFNIVVVGDSNVGKSAMGSLYTLGTFVERHNEGPLAVCKDVMVEQKRVRLKILITSGKEPFRSVVWAFYQTSVGIMLVFDLTSRDSFDNLRKWYEEVQHYSMIEHKVLALVCNKCEMLELEEGEDEERHWISFEEGEQFAATHSMAFY